MTTVLYDPGLALSADILGMSGELGAESSDKIESAYTALGKVRSFAVMALVTNVGLGDVVTLLIQTASDGSGTGVATLTPKTESAVATVTGTSAAALKTVLIGECNAIPAGHTHVRATVSTDNASGEEVVAVFLLRKLSS